LATDASDIWVVLPRRAVWSTAVTCSRMAAPVVVVSVAARLPGTTRVQKMPLSGVGSPEATLCGNCQAAPVASAGMGKAAEPVAGSFLSLEQAVTPSAATDTVRKLPILMNSRLFIVLSAFLVRVNSMVGERRVCRGVNGNNRPRANGFHGRTA
jgi:hypothetical protein